MKRPRRILRSDQLELLNRCFAAMRAGHRSVCMQAPTGWGKTVAMSEIASKLLHRHKSRTLTLAHRQEIVMQTALTYAEAGLDVGVIASARVQRLTMDLFAERGVFDRYDTYAPTQISMIQTFASRARRGRPMPPADLLLVDEAHHLGAKTWRWVFDRYNEAGALVLGATATPRRLDGKSLGRQWGGVFDWLEPGPQIPDLIADGVLSPMRVFVPVKQIDTEGLAERAGDFEVKGLALRSSEVAGDAVAEYKKLLAPATALAFCVNIAHAEEIAAMFRRAGVPAESIDGGMNERERFSVLARLKAGELKVVSSCDLISEGFDAPAVGGALLMRPTKSIGVFLQQVGRTLRTAPGKEAAVIIDHAGNFGRFDYYPSKELEWKLEPPRKKKPTSEAGTSALVCAKCLALNAPTARVCFNCGAQLAGARGDEKQIKRVDANMREIGAHSPTQAGWNALNEAVARNVPHEQAAREAREAHGLSAAWEKNALMCLRSWWRTPLGGR